MTMPFDDNRLAEYMERFYGYGSYHGDWWLVGMEEGGGATEAEIQTRLRVWDMRGRRELEDVSIFESSPELAKWFSPRPPLQATWRGLIRLILAAEGRKTDAETARAYQGSELGRVNGNNCILELLPLPSVSVSQWTYAEQSSLPALRNRETYVKQIGPRRVEHIRQRIQECQPRAVIFYSRSYLAWWEQIVGARFSATDASGIQMIQMGGTLFALTIHPTYRGASTEYFVRAGRVIADRLARRS